MAKQIIYYTSRDGCKPCEEITKLIEEGKFFSSDTDEVDVVDIDTDEGFQRFSDHILSKQPGAVPSAYLDGVKCQIMVTDGEVQFECLSNDQPVSPEEKPPPPEEDT